MTKGFLEKNRKLLEWKDVFDRYNNRCKKKKKTTIVSFEGEHRECRAVHKNFQDIFLEGMLAKSPSHPSVLCCLVCVDIFRKK